MPPTAQALILACRQAFEAQEFELVLAITELLSRHHPERPEPWRVRGEACVELQRPGDAVAAYQRAVERAPADAQLRLRLAKALAGCGRHGEAAASYEAAFALDPGQLEAVHGVLTYRRIDPEDPGLQVVRAIAAGAPATAGSRAFACFLLGRILSGAGRDGEAFRFYAEANQLTHQALATEPEPRGPREWLSWWRPRLKAGASDWPRAQIGAPANCPALLITGLPRSGKSLLEHLLGTHPQLACGEELGGLHQLIESCSGDPTQRRDQLRGEGASSDSARNDGVSRLAELYGTALAASERPEAQRLIDTAPPNLWDLGHLADLDPRVPVILCRRDPLDLGAAIFCKTFSQGHRWSYDQQQLGAMLAAAERAIALWSEQLPNPLQVIDYETVVADPNGCRDRLLEWLGLDPDLCRPAPQADHGAVRPGLHGSHSPILYGEINCELVGFGKRFGRQLHPMQLAFEATRAELEQA